MPNTTTVAEDGNYTLLTTREAAEFLRRRPQTLANWRCDGVGPAHVRVAGSVLYRLSDLRAYVDACARGEAA